MVDSAPPSRFSVVERGGRLVVIDRETGQTPLSAAERMEIHDRQLGIEPVRPERRTNAPDLSAAARAESGLSARPAPTHQQAAQVETGKPRVTAMKAERGKQPWASASGDRPALKTNATPAPARIPARAAPQSGNRKTLVTGKWWDAKGPRTIELGPQGQQTLSGGFLTLFVVAVIAAIVVLFIEPLLLFVGAFLLFRFGSNILGPLGARIVDQAIAQKG